MKNVVAAPFGLVKITILGSILPIPAKRGGAIEKAWQLLGEEFVRMGHEVVHISRYCDGLPKEEKINRFNTSESSVRMRPKTHTF